MVIDKNCTIYLFNNVPLTSNYSDTVYFESAAEQANAFMALSHLTLSNYSYTRVNNNTIRVNFGAPATNESLYTYNYLMFRNTSYASKWYYAFITRVNYVNNFCYEISYKIDALQTFMFEVDWATNVFVEREHSPLDELFGSLTEENIPTGEYVFSNQTDLINPKNPIIVIACSVDKNNLDATGGLYGNIYSGVEYLTYSVLNVGDVNDFISSLTVNNRATAIVAIFMAYDGFFGNDSNSGAKTRKIGVKINTDGLIDGYQPRNKKLYNHPYSFLYITSGNGNSMNVKPQFTELNASGQIEMTLAGETSCNPSITLYPMGYKGVGINELNFNEKMTLTGFPQCTYTIDSFKAWLAQNAGSLAINTLSAAGQLAASVVVPELAPALAVSAGTGILTSLTQLVTEAAKPPQANGASGAGGMFAHGYLTFMAYYCTVTRERAEIIDDYFSKKGYAKKQLKVLQRSARPYWNYTETRECDLHGAAPDDVMQEINKACDRGITWWKGLQYVGNYSLDNSPQTS